MNQGIPVQETTREIKSLARAALRDVFGKVIICYLIYQLVTSFLPEIITSFVPGLSLSYTVVAQGRELTYKYSYLTLVVILIFNGPFRLALSKVYLGAIRERKVDTKDIFWGFRFFPKAFLTWLLIIICLALGMVPVAAITGIIASLLMILGGPMRTIGMVISSIGILASSIVVLLVYFCLAMSFYVIVDNTGIKPMAALRQSLNIMKPNLSRLIILRVSYLGWLFVAIIMSSSLSEVLASVIPADSVILTILTGIPLIFVSVYMDMGEAFFYEFAIGHLRKTTPSPMVNSAQPGGFGY